MIGDSKCVLMNPFWLTIMFWTNINKCLSRSLIKCFKVKQIILEMEINNSWMKRPNPFFALVNLIETFFVFVFYSLIDLPWRNWSCLIWTWKWLKVRIQFLKVNKSIVIERVSRIQPLSNTSTVNQRIAGPGKDCKIIFQSIANLLE